MEAYLESLGTAGPALLAVAGFLALAHLVGHPWLRRLDDLSVLERALLSVTLGFDLLALVAFPLAWGGLLFSLPLQPLLAVALALAAFRLVSYLRRCGCRSFPWHLLTLVAPALLFLGHGFCHPFSWDDLVYQVTVPLRWSQTNSLQVFLDNPYSGFPGAFSVLNAFLISAGGILAPGLWNACLWLILTLQLLSLLRDNMGQWQSAIMALSFSLCLPMVMEAISSYAEIFLVIHLAAILRLSSRMSARSVGVGFRDAILLGLLAALAASIKLTGMIVPVLTGGFLVLKLWFRSPHAARASLARSAVFLLSFLAVATLFYSRPALATGNPLYPYFAPYFTDDEAVLAMSAYHHEAATVSFGVTLEPSAATVRAFLTAPFLLALSHLGLETSFDGWLGMQILVHLFLVACVLFGWIRGRFRNPRFWLCLAWACALYVFWFVSSWQARFLLPTFFVFTLAASFAWPLLGRLSRVVVTSALLLLTLGSIPAQNLAYLPIRGLLTGKVTQVDYIQAANINAVIPDRYLDLCGAILEHTPADARILLLFEQRGLYIPRDYRIGTPSFQQQFFTPSSRTRTAADFLAVLEREGITHVLVGYNVEDPDRTANHLEETRAFQELIVSMRNAQLEVLWEFLDGTMLLHGFYKVKAS